MTEWKESLKIARLMMVLSSLSPLFILWAIRGNPLISDYYLICGCLLMVVIPNAFLYERILAAKRNNDKRTLKVGLADDHRDHLLVYLFAILLPLYDANLSEQRDFAATLVAFFFIIFLFWHLNLHYMNQSGHSYTPNKKLMPIASATPSIWNKEKRYERFL